MVEQVGSFFVTPKEKAKAGDSPIVKTPPSGSLISIPDKINKGRNFPGGSSRGGGTGGGVSASVIPGISDIVERQQSTPIQQLIQPDPISTPLSQPKSFVQQQAESLRQPTSVVSAAPDQPGLFGVQQKIQRERRMLATREMEKASVLGGLTDIGLGFSSSLVGFGIFGQQLVTSPIQTVKSIPGGIVSGYKSIRGGSLARELRESPGFVLGELGGDIAILKGTGKGIKFAGKGIEAGRTVISSKFKPIQTLETGEKIIVDIPKVGELGLIPPGKGLGKEGAATLRGGFGFSKAEQSKFIGVEGVATSQRDLTNILQRNLGKTVDIQEIEKGFGLFGTPADPLTKRLQTRTSRLGESPKEASLKDIISGDFTLKGPKPEIILFPEEKVGRKGGFQPFGKQSSELEVTTDPPRLGGPTGFEIVETPAVTLIEGKRVPIRIGKLTSFSDDINNLLNGKKPTKSKKTSGRDSTSELISEPVLPTKRIGVSSGLTGMSNLISGIPKFSKPLRRGATKKTVSPKVPSPVVPNFPSLDIPTPGRAKSPIVDIPLLPPGISPPVFGPPRFFPSKAPPLTGFPKVGKPQKTAKVKGKRKLRRTPSTISAALGIVETPFKFGLKEERSGLIARGLFSPSRKKRKSSFGDVLGF